MAQTEIQIDDPRLDYQVLDVNMGGSSYVMTIQQCAGPNTVRSGYYMDLRLPDGTAVVLSRRIRLGDLLQGLRRVANVPQVRLLVVDTSGADAEPERRDLGDRVRLLVDTEV